LNELLLYIKPCWTTFFSLRENIGSLKFSNAHPTFLGRYSQSVKRHLGKLDEIESGCDRWSLLFSLLIAVC